METQVLLSDLHGLPLEKALSILAANGRQPKIVYTSDPRHTRTEGTVRVLRATETELIVAYFQDQIRAD